MAVVLCFNEARAQCIRATMTSDTSLCDSDYVYKLCEVRVQWPGTVELAAACGWVKVQNVGNTQSLKFVRRL